MPSEKPQDAIEEYDSKLYNELKSLNYEQSKLYSKLNDLIARKKQIQKVRDYIHTHKKIPPGEPYEV